MFPWYPDSKVHGANMGPIWVGLRSQAEANMDTAPVALVTVDPPAYDQGENDYAGLELTTVKGDEIAPPHT